MKSLYAYSDFRNYLQDYFDEKKKSTRFFTHRYFSRKAGFKSPNQMQLIMQGKRNLTESAIFQVASVLNLNSTETSYFRDFVGFCQAKTMEEKNHFYQQMLAHKQGSDIKELERDTFEFFTNWLHAVVREWIAVAPFQGNCKELAGKIWPLVTASQVQKSVDLLEKHGLIAKGKDGVYVQTSQNVAPSPEVRDVALIKSHQGLLDLSKRALTEQPHSDISISGLTLGVSRQTFETIKSELDLVRKKILNLAAADKSPERVYQLNMQLIPMGAKKELQ